MLLPITQTACALEKLGLDAREYISKSRAEHTTRSYRTGWRQFQQWAEHHGREALPASSESVALFITDLANRVKPSTIDARLAAISSAHRAAGHDSPTKAEAVRLVRRGIRRTVGTSQRQVRPISVEDLRVMVEAMGDHPAGHRDRALLLVGFAGALRRSELAGLDVEDVFDGNDGLTVHIRRSKVDQEGQGRTVGIPYGSHPSTCPVRAWRRWLEVSGITEGAAFRSIDRKGRVGASRLSDRSVATIVKNYATVAGIDAEQVSGHSLRAGLATEAARAGVPERVIAATTGHRGTAMLRKYIREGSLFRENAAAAVGL